MSEIGNVAQASNIIDSTWATDKQRLEAHAYRLKASDCSKHLAEAVAELCLIAARDIDERDRRSRMRGLGV